MTNRVAGQDLVDQDPVEVLPTPVATVGLQLAEKLVEPETVVCMVTLTRPLLAAKRDLSALK